MFFSPTYIFIPKTNLFKLFFYKIISPGLHFSGVVQPLQLFW